MAVPGQRFVAGDYWRSKHDDDIEEQRKLLISLENRRKELHPTGSPTPIRFVYVAWGIIRLGDRFLLHHREDRSRSEVKNYVFPGGRFRPLDLPAEKWDAATLRHLHKSASRLAMGALEQTLHRELGEELKLSSEDWSATPSVVLEPYRKIEGSKNAHELTEYLIALYAISLTPEVRLACSTKLMRIRKRWSGSALKILSIRLGVAIARERLSRLSLLILAGRRSSNISFRMFVHRARRSTCLILRNLPLNFLLYQAHLF